MVKLIKYRMVSLACMEAVSPLTLSLSDNGNLLGSYKFESLSQAFLQKRTDLEEFFVGEVYGKYLDMFAENLLDQKYFEKQIYSTLLYQVLFFGLKAFHRSAGWQQDFYMVKNSFPLNCNFSRTVSELNDQHVQTTLRGEAAEQFSLQSVLSGRRVEEVPGDALAAMVELKYTTHKTSKQLLEVEAGIALFDGEELYRKQKIKLAKV